MKGLLINADDFGYDADTLTATKTLMVAGVVRSATILVGWPKTPEAIAFARENPKLSFGLHFNIAEGHPAARLPVPSLIDSDGRFRRAIPQRMRALTGLLKPRDLQLELEAQLGVLADHGLRPSHLDSHGHLHKFPPVMAALRPVLARFGIVKVRTAQTLHDNARFYSGWLDRRCTRAIRRHHLTSDAFFNTRRHDDAWFERLVACLDDGVTELGVHPGSEEWWRRAETTPLLQPDLLNRLAKRGITIVSYHQLGRGA